VSVEIAVAKIYIDGRAYEVEEGQNLLHTALSLGFDLPYFCWHPAMGSVGACRQCAVKQFRDEGDTRGKIVMACMTPALEGTRISIEDDEAQEFRRSVIELMMASHPHDCPVCDEGGECHLQDMTVLIGQTYRRFIGKKRTFRNQELGPLVNHEMNRCIQCYRCLRFYRDYAGGRDFEAFGLRNHVFFGRQKDGVLESEFSGNLVEICPTGVFTDKRQREHYTRTWNLQTAPSVCVHCAVGCNTITGERQGTLRRIRNRYNGEVNGYFLCDRGRYGYEFVDGPRRVRQALARPKPDAASAPVQRDDALALAASFLAGGAKAVGIGSSRASLEANLALRTLVGDGNFYAGVSAGDHRLTLTALEILQKGPARSPSLSEIGLCDAVFVLGEDVTQTAPMVALALRQSVRRQPMKIAPKLQLCEWDDAGVRRAIHEDKGPLFIAAPYGTKLDEIATKTYRAAPDALARLGFAVARLLDPKGPAVDGLPEGVGALAEEIAAALMEAERPLVVSGTGAGSEALLQAAANVAWALRRKGRPAELSFALPECDSLGLALLGGGDLESALEAAKANTVIILENDLYRRAAADSVDALLKNAGHVIVIDHTTNATTEKADVLLPAASFAEADGTLVSSEGRAQRYYKVLPPGGDCQESWRWLRDLAAAAGRPGLEEWRTFDGAVAALAAAMPVFAPVAEIAPPADFRIVGQPVARQAGRFSGRTSITADVSVHEPKPPEDVDSPLSFSMEGYQGQPPSALIPRFWAPGWNSIQSLNKFQSEVGGPLRGGDPGRRLIEPSAGAKAPYFADVPAAFEAPAGRWLVVPAYHIFGSEELSVLASGIAELATQPYLGLNPADAESLGTDEEGQIDVVLGEWTRRLPIKLMASLPVGLAALPAGLPGLEWAAQPVWAELKSPSAGKAKGKRP
jgi:NADH-quinone oxidoreductase subunit G